MCDTYVAGMLPRGGRGEWTPDQKQFFKWATRYLREAITVAVVKVAAKSLLSSGRAGARKREATTRDKHDVDLDADTQVATTATA